jgi:DNA helicase HerA-like ATPase
LKLWLFDLPEALAARRVQRSIDAALAAVDYVSDEVSRYYFGKAREYLAQGIVATEIELTTRTADELKIRLDVVDLPSFPDGASKLLALNSVLSTIWRQARLEWDGAFKKGEKEDERVPTFIVVDEAHNLIPRDPKDLGPRALLEQFRTIAAEGRKYGLYLILCTQRPDKVDPLVLSECENCAIMRLGSRSVLKITKELFGLEDAHDPKLLKCLSFDTGRAVLIGRWSPEPEILYTAMRRTEEGGRNLRDEFWANPYPASTTAKPAAAAPLTTSDGAGNRGGSTEHRLEDGREGTPLSPDVNPL